MVCPVCQTTNDPDSNFCIQCSHRLSIVCPRCSQRVVSHAAYCGRCGYSLKGGIQAASIEGAAAEAPPVDDKTSSPEAGKTRPALPQLPPAQTSLVQPTLNSAEAPEDSGKVQNPLRGPGRSAIEHYLPKDLMRKLESARESGDMVGERRVVTILFCDVKGSTYAADKLDPEEWSEIINGAFEHMIKPIFKYEGTVARLMGDGILAFFGAPLAHEDDPQRALLAGLDIKDEFAPYREKILQEWGFEIDVRIGINTGLVVVGTVGSDLRMEYTALGDAINMASRMEQHAEPGSVQIAYNTYKLVKGLFEIEELGGIAVKGKDDPVLAYRVLSRRVGQSRMRGVEGLHAEMVGRDREMEVLERVVNDVNQGVGRIIFILGEAGLGKSRLINETHQIFQEIVQEGGNWYETSSLSYETNQAYALIQRLIQRISGIRYDDAPRVIQKKLEPIIEDLPEEFRTQANSIFGTLFGITPGNGNGTLDGDEFKQELYSIMDLWFRQRFANVPTALVFDDMHWGDAASIQLINNLYQLTDVIPLVIICAMRIDHSSPGWQIKGAAEENYRHRYTEISLEPLSEADSNELINRLLAIADLHDELRRNILEKSDGNPFFIEEVIRALIENKIVNAEERVEDGAAKTYWVSANDGSEFSIPDNLQSLLAARMDQLEESTRATLQLASVIGRNFYMRVLRAVNTTSRELDKQVGTLLRLDMIRESARVPEVEYSFRNPLTQEAVYKTILLKNRREFHRRVAEAMEDLYQERLEGKFGLLAHHFTLAGENDKAISYCRMAAHQAVNVYAYEEAEKNLRVALKLLEAENNVELHAAVLEELADVCRLVRNFVEAISIYQEALESWAKQPEGDPNVQLRLNRKIVEIATEAKWSVDAETYKLVSEVSKKSQSSLHKSLRMIRDNKPHPETVKMLVALSTDAWRVQTPVDWKKAQRYADEAVKIADELESQELLSLALGALATALDGQSLLREHLQVAQRRVGISEQNQEISSRERIDALRGMGAAFLYVGEYENALPYLESAESLAVEVKAPDQIANAVGLMAQCYFRMDRWDEVIEVEGRWRDLDMRYTRERVGET